ncbi:sulfotransferase [Methylovulum psychrotolerans]|uniref:Sulfotransferase family protein n=1 Tax=Methylovulum psychrotolerans TaxID=1704499 RepID=A0A2S5CPA1_9GAMM|nr:sulfotransferase [Methylovulum psychrotolerans]POZ52587.1 hypothetical protein AADEFJLK_01189 [Methylovulum psychrotolerans]
MSNFWLLEYQAITKIEDYDLDSLMFAIDNPSNGELFSNHMVEIAGWVVSLKEGFYIENLQFIIGDRGFHEVTSFSPRPDVKKVIQASKDKAVELNCGFRVSIPAYLTNKDCPLMLVAILSDGVIRYPINLCTLVFLSSRKELLGQLAFTPVVVTSTGRSGSTILCRALTHHPNAGVSNVLDNPGELRFIEHFLMNCLIQTGQCPGTDLNKGSLYSSLEYLERPPFLAPSLFKKAGDSKLKAYVCHTYPKDYQKGLFTLLASYFATCYTSPDKPAPTHLVEKSWDPIGIYLGHLMIEGFKEVILIRNFSDYLSSRIKFLKKIHQTDSLENEIELYASRIANFVRSVNFRGNCALVVRFEDLVSGDEAVLGGILDFVGLENTPDILKRLSSVILERDTVFEQHVTQDEQLDPTEQTLVDRIISKFSTEFGSLGLPVK